MVLLKRNVTYTVLIPLLSADRYQKQKLHFLIGVSFWVTFYPECDCEKHGIV